VEVQLERQPADGKEQMIVRVLDSGPACPRSVAEDLEPFTGSMMPAPRHRRRGLASPSRIAPSGCTAGNFVHPTAKKVG